MIARNILASFLTVLVLCWSSVLMADDDANGASGDLVTVNINKADAKTLASVLDGVGLRRAQAIVAYREKNGRFFAAEELSAVRGIGKATVEKNGDRIVVQ